MVWKYGQRYNKYAIFSFFFLLYYFFYVCLFLKLFDSWNRYAHNKNPSKASLLYNIQQTEFLLACSFCNSIFVKVLGTEILLLTQQLLLKFLQDILSFHVTFMFRGLRPHETYIMTCISALLNKARTCIVIFLHPVYV